MKERPILFSCHEVIAIRDGRKNQARRIVKPQPKRIPCPYGQPGDRLWVRETWRSFGDSSAIRPAVPHSCQVRYEADCVTEWRPVPEGARGVYCGELKRRSPIHMPRWASRITLELTGVRIERLQDISKADAIAEGIERDAAEFKNYDDSCDEFPWLGGVGAAKLSYKTLWEFIHGPGSWEANPFVWVLEFKEVTA